MNSDILTLKEKLDKVKNLDWIECKNKNKSVTGKTLENLLEINPDNFEIPDYNTVEIKSKVSKRENYIDLFCATPDSYVLETKRLYDKYAYLDSNNYKILNFVLYGEFLKPINNKYSAKLRIDYKNKKVIMEVYNKNNELIMCYSKEKNITIQEGIKKLKICDICRTPLNICQNVAKANNFSWEVEQKNVFEGIDEKYDAVINDAFITRFEYDKKRIVLEKIWDSLRDEGVYITTMRNDWNYGNAIVPNSAEKESFIEKAVHSAERKNIDSKKAKVAASRYIEKMKSYPIRDEKMLENLIDGLFNIVYIGKGRVEGECTRTTYFRLILQKQSKKSKKV